MKADTAPSPTSQDISAVVDEYGRLKAKLTAEAAIRKPDEARLKECEALILEACQDAGAHEHRQFRGSQYVVTVGPKHYEKTIDLVKLFRRLKSALFLQFCTFSFKALTEAVPDEEEQKRYYQQERTGRRDLSAVRIPE